MYDVGQLIPLFSTILGDYKQYSNYEYYFYCPFCHHHNPKLAINLGKGKWHCWKCGSAGNRLISLFKRLDVSSHQIKELQNILHEEIRIVKRTGEEVKAELYLPAESKPLWKYHSELDYKHAIRYLLKRGITKDDILKYNLHFCTEGVYQNRILIPNYDEAGKLNFFTGRDFFDAGPLKYKNPPVSKNIIGFEYYINWDYPIVLCEGVFDAIAIKRNAIPLYGKTLSRKLQQKLLEKRARKIYVALDSDAAHDAIKIISEFMREGQEVYYVRLDEKDPSQLGFSTVQSAIAMAKKMTFKEVLSMKLA